MSPTVRSPVVVTGATGFLGAHVLRELVDAQPRAEVHAISRGPVSRTHGVMWWHVDLIDYAVVDRVMNSIRPATVIHLAGRLSTTRDIRSLRPAFHGVFEGTMNLLTAAAMTGERPRVVVAGSLEEPTNGATPSSPYAAAKAAGTAIARMGADLWSLPTVVLRLGMVYGPGQADRTRLVPHVIACLEQGRAPALTDGGRVVDWIYVDDAIGAIVAAASVPGLGGDVIDIGSGSGVSVRETVRMLESILGVQTPFDVDATGIPTAHPARIADPQAAAAKLRWRARTELRAGLERTVDWYRENRTD